MTPVDLAHEDQMTKAVAVATDLAKRHGADITVVGLSSTAPGPAGRTPDEFKKNLDAFAAKVGEEHGVTVKAHPIFDTDPTADIDRRLVSAISEVGADLVVMASHVPGRFGGPSHGGSLAAHAPVSVMIVRDQ